MALWSWSGLKAKDREETQSMLPSAESYEELIRKFRWAIPEVYNIGQDCCDKWADGSGRLAILHKRNDGALDRYSFDWLKSESNRFANALKAQGVERGDRVAVLLPQRPWRMSRSISWAPSRYRCLCFSAPMLWNTACATAARASSSRIATAWRRYCRCVPACPS